MRKYPCECVIPLPYSAECVFKCTMWQWIFCTPAGCESHPSSLDGFQQKSTSLFYFAWNIQDQVAVENDGSAGIELLTDKLLGANGLSIDLHGGQNRIPFTSLDRFKQIQWSLILALAWSAVPYCPIPSSCRRYRCNQTWESKRFTFIYLGGVENGSCKFCCIVSCPSGPEESLKTDEEREDQDTHRSQARWLHAQFSLVLRGTTQNQQEPWILSWNKL